MGRLKEENLYPFNWDIPWDAPSRVTIRQQKKYLKIEKNLREKNLKKDHIDLI